MGSLMSTMKTGVTVTFLLSVLSGFSIIHCSQPLQWIQATNGKIPRNAVKVSSRNKTPHYPCRVSTSSQTGAHSYGVLSGGERACKYADTSQQHLLSSFSFEILVGFSEVEVKRIIQIVLQVGDQSRVGLKWLGGRPSEAEIIQGGAIPCHLNTGTQSDCYFGQGVYSDGICHEEFGVVIPSKRRVFMEHPYTSNKVSICGVYRFIVYN